jgi:GNAT superfamily N-acetyltransferase
VPYSTRPKIVFEPHAEERQRQLIVDNLDAFNIAATGLAAYYPVNLFLKTGNGEVLGGLLGLIWGGWLHVRTLWVAEALRGGGHGKELLRAAESFARERGCVGCHLNTHSFQARPFYEKLGYRLVGTMEDVPVGHAKYFLMKRFRRPRSGSQSLVRRKRIRKPR